MSDVDARASLPAGSAPHLWGVTWPLLCSLALSLSLHFTDSFFLAHISDQAAAAAGALFPLLGAAIVVFSAVGQAGGSVASQLSGARRFDELPVTYLTLVGFNTLLGLSSSLGFVLFHNALPRWLGLSGTVADQAAAFLVVVGGGQFLKAVQIAYGNILNSRRQTKWAFVEALITNFCNITLNVALLRGWFGLKQSVTGIAWVTVVSLGIGMLFTISIVHLKLRVRFALGRNRAHFSERLRRVLGIGLPSALEPISYQFAQMTVNAIIIPWGASALATRTYVFNFYMVTTVLLAVAFGIGTQVMVSHAVGAEDFRSANAEMRRGLAFGVIGNFVLAGMLVLFHRPLLGLLTRDPSIHRFAGPLFLLGMAVEPGRAVNIVAGGALRSSGDARYTALIGICLMWTVGMPLCFFFGRYLGLGLTGIWVAFACDEILRGVVNYRRWLTGHWKEYRISLRPRPESLEPS
ncbi:MAG TPA: MATE family efflux transporter [Polyangiaceae bacterium]|nr:MATE family efflux transporter [Polyangiaceae bacterium]